MNTTANLNGTWTLYFGDDDGQILTTAQVPKPRATVRSRRRCRVMSNWTWCVRALNKIHF
jgi:hypothetical protein